MSSKTPSHAKSDHEHQRLLVNDIASIFQRRRVKRLRSRDLLVDLSMMENRPWSGIEGNHRGGAKLARFLAPCRIRPVTIRFGKKPYKGYYRECFEDKRVTHSLASRDSSGPSVPHPSTKSSHNARCHQSRLRPRDSVI
jgi:hypothetical protein